MPSSVTLLLLMGLSVCTSAEDGGEEQTLGAEAGPWVTVTLEAGAVASIQLQLQEVKRGKASQFFGLMGKRVRGYQMGQRGLLGRRASSTKGSVDEDQGAE
ncbi:tachykinin-4 preproprotein [Oryctolagus cuniculus]|uniref:Tachykinin-4 n=1 Tax=Oryctolagus cuniculus TaxID=9986 RepID=TKN4_RABIT|nr:tachykinin-4 preproprotein [Oryctolagus cuniculus]Q6ECK6.1 RecName: Full=Tachykinin-4; AltName: Full=Preprotachykinin-C; Short=PPT-C; Contains: RecName: Full=Endokinin-1; Contains: RecName: Full=Endokinin-2; Flags: Precursor [Oryctolagus cuniculus]AAS46598.1 alpha tachykinin 4 precursor [Oryctolagus cuniculus]